MNLKFFYGKIGVDYAWEVDLFRKYRDFKEGLTIFSFTIEYNKYMADHNPQFQIMLIICNYKMFEFTVYNVWHIENPQSPYYQQHLEEENEP